MNTRDLLTVGLKLLAACFAVLGVSVLAKSLLDVITEVLVDLLELEPLFYAFTSGPTLASVMPGFQPFAYLVCAYLLARKTDWCLRMLGCPPKAA